jgi:hypothetical protein
MTTTTLDIANRARMRLRDFPIFFEAPFAGTAPTLRLPHPLVDPESFSVWTPDGTPVASGWSLDPRNGILKIKDPTTFPDGVGVSGYHFTWFLTDDLEYYAHVTQTYNSYDREPTDDPIEAEVNAMGTVVEALWALCAEFGTDIDVSTPEGMFIPAHQRFSQVWTMLGVAQEEYKHHASMLGMGLDRIEQFTLRRVAYLTNRYVPVYKTKEVGDWTYPERIFPAIPDGTMDADKTAIAPTDATVVAITEGSSWR